MIFINADFYVQSRIVARATCFSCLYAGRDSYDRLVLHTPLYQPKFHKCMK